MEITKLKKPKRINKTLAGYALVLSKREARAIYNSLKDATPSALARASGRSKFPDKQTDVMYAFVRNLRNKILGE